MKGGTGHWALGKDNEAGLKFGSNNYGYRNNKCLRLKGDPSLWTFLPWRS